MDWLSGYQNKVKSASAAIASSVRSDNRVFLTGNCSVPKELVSALVAYAPQVTGVEVAQTLSVSPATWAVPELDGHLRSNVMFIGHNIRQAIWENRADYTPVLLSEFPLLFKAGILPIDVALVHISRPDDQGYCSFSIENGLTKTPAESAKVIVAQVNVQMPFISGDTLIHVNKLDHIVEVDEPLDEFEMASDPNDPVVEGNCPEYC